MFCPNVGFYYVTNLYTSRFDCLTNRRHGLVGYDECFTRIRSRVRFPMFVRFHFSSVK
jgi:hypothetical protein